MTFGPGAIWDIANVSSKSRSFIQPRNSTAWRCIFRNHRVGAAERQQRHDAELHGERDQDIEIGFNAWCAGPPQWLTARAARPARAAGQAHDADRQGMVAARMNGARPDNCGVTWAQPYSPPRDRPTGRGRRNAAQDASHGFDIAIALIENPGRKHHAERHQQKSGPGRDRPGRSAHSRAEHRSQVDDIGPGRNWQSA